MSTVTARLLAAADFTSHLPEAVPMPTIEVHPWADDIKVTWSLNAIGQKDQRTAAAAIRRAIGGEWTKHGTGSTFWLRHDGSLGNIALDYTIFCDREQVCRRVVVGTETVTVPAVEASPEQVVEREVVEWQCDPITPAQVAS